MALVFQDILLQGKNMVKLIHTLADHGDDVNCCAFSSSLLATCSLDKTVHLYSLSGFTELPHSPLKFHSYAVSLLLFLPFRTYFGFMFKRWYHCPVEHSKRTDVGSAGAALGEPCEGLPVFPRLHLFGVRDS